VQENLAPRRTYDRDSVEFGRTVAFTDGLFAIAMTLLVVSLAVPTLSDTDSVGQLADKLSDDSATFVSFAISFAVIGRYWLAHHTYFSALARLDRTLIALNLLYLAFIAFLPFPTALLGEYFENPLSIAIYASNVAIVSGMEVVLFAWAQNHDLLEKKLPRDVYRYGAAMSLAPVVFFLLSIPVAFVSTTVAACCWFLGIPFAAIAERWKPEGADELLMGG
jgi:TMEM175 potassium channel family protein